MSQRLPPNASVATNAGGAKMHAPAAARNANDLAGLIAHYARSAGRALELASGTGQHVVTFAEACPHLTWQPSEVDAERLASIAAYRAEASLDNVLPPLLLDACASNWSEQVPAQDLILTINLAHLVPDAAVKHLIAEAAQALTTNGMLILYGPFKRSGELTSEGDARFDASLRGADPEIGYKDDVRISAWLTAAGLPNIAKAEMPANNLAFVATR